MNVQIQEYNGSTYESVNPNANNADTLDGYHAQHFLNEISSLKTSVSNGKSAIAGAITDKRISTSSSDSFQTMANNISKIGVNNVSDFLNQNVFVTYRIKSSFDAICYVKHAFSKAKIIVVESSFMMNTSIYYDVYTINTTFNNLMSFVIPSTGPINTSKITCDRYIYNQGSFSFSQSLSTNFSFLGRGKQEGDSYIFRIRSNDIYSDNYNTSMYFLLEN